MVDSLIRWRLRRLGGTRRPSSRPQPLDLVAVDLVAFPAQHRVRPPVPPTADEPGQTLAAAHADPGPGQRVLAGSAGWSGAGPRSGTPAAAGYRVGPGACPRPGAVATGSPISLGDLPQRVNLQLLTGDDLHEPGVLGLQFLQPPVVVGFIPPN